MKITSTTADYKSKICHMTGIYDLVYDTIYMQIYHTDLINSTCRMIEDILLDVFDIHTTVISDTTTRIPKFIIPDEVFALIYKNFPEYTL